MRLLKHNKQTLEEVEYFVKQQNNCCVVNACGSGKTSIISQFIKNHKGNTFLILTKQKNAKKYYIQCDDVFKKRTVQIITYQQMHYDVVNGKIPKYRADFYLADEAHYLGAPKWRKSYQTLINEYAPICIGFTATPQRFEQQGTDDSIVKDFFNGNSAGNYTAKKLEKLKVLVPPKYILSIYNMDQIIQKQTEKVDLADISENKKEYFYEKLNDILTNWQNTNHPSIIFQKHLPQFLYKEKCNRILVYTKNTNTINQDEIRIYNWVRNALPEKSIKIYQYTCKTSENQLSEFLTEDDTDIKILLSIDKVTETLHIQDLRIAIMLRPAVSHRLITQQFGRLNDMNNKKQPLVIDMVNNLSKLQENAGYIERYYNNAKSESSNNNIIIPKIQTITHLFKLIDDVNQKRKKYKYKGFIGSVNDICTIWNYDIQEVKLLLETNYDDIEIALEKAHRKDIWYKPHSQKFFEGKYEFSNTVLSIEEQRIAEQNLHILNNFIKLKQISNEDIKQDLALLYLKYIPRCIQYINTPWKFRMDMHLRLQRSYVLLFRYKVNQEEFFDYSINADDIYTYNREEQLYQEMDRNEIRNRLYKAINTFPDRTRDILIDRYGLNGDAPLTLEETAKIYNITKERIRQIEAKALRVLRHPEHSIPLRQFIK